MGRRSACRTCRQEGMIPAWPRPAQAGLHQDALPVRGRLVWHTSAGPHGMRVDVCHALSIHNALPCAVQLRMTVPGMLTTSCCPATSVT